MGKYNFAICEIIMESNIEINNKKLKNPQNYQKYKYVPNKNDLTHTELASAYAQC